MCFQLDGLVCFCLTDPLCSKSDQEREAWCPSQQKLKGELARGDGSSESFLQMLGVFLNEVLVMAQGTEKAVSSV